MTETNLPQPTDKPAVPRVDQVKLPPSTDAKNLTPSTHHLSAGRLAVVLVAAGLALAAGVAATYGLITTGFEMDGKTINRPCERGDAGCERPPKTGKTTGGKNTGASETPTPPGNTISPERQSFMQKYTVQNATERHAVCNDNSPGVYYYRPALPEYQDKWVVWFEGGGGCFDTTGCDERWAKENYLMTSKKSGDTSKKDGIISSDPKLNPDFYGWNQVMLNYCSSDSWSGDGVIAGTDREYVLAGWDLTEAIFEDLADDDLFTNNMSTASEILITGSSAGGGGASQNLDRIALWFPDAATKGVIDSSWFLDQFYTEITITREEVFDTRGKQTDATCAAANPDAPNVCTAFNVLYPYLETDTFIYIDQIDRKKLDNAGITQPSDPDQLAWIIDYAADVRDSLTGVPAVFSPAYGQHVVLSNEWFNEAVIDGLSPQQAIGDWYFGRGTDFNHIFTYAGDKQTR